MTRKLSIALPLLGVVIAIIWIIVSARRAPHSAPLVDPSTSPYSRTIAATGLVEASDRNFNLAPPVSGQLTALFVRENDIVHTGDKLYQIDDREQRAALQNAEATAAKSRSGILTAEATIATQQANLLSARAAVDSAKAAYDDAKQIADRTQSMHQGGIVSDQTSITATMTRDGASARLKQAEAQVAQAQAQIQSAQAALSQQKADLQSTLAAANQQRVMLDKLTIRAPADGKILQVNNRTGEYLSSASTIAPVLFGDTGSLLIRVDIDEINASHFRPGSKATATLKGDSSRRFPLEFVRVVPYMVPKQSLTGSNSERVDVRVLQVEFRFTPPAFPVYVGQQVDVFIDAPETAGGPALSSTTP